MLTNILIKTFIKNEKTLTEEKKRTVYAFLASIVGIIVNVLLFAGKLALGIIFGAVSIIADAFNNISDAGSSLITLFGFKMASKHADNDHPLGHGRFEYISAFIVDILIIFVGFELLKSSIEKIINPTEVLASTLSIIILGIFVLVKVWLFAFYRKIAKKINSSALKGVALDSITDACATAFVLITTIISKEFGIVLDGYAGLIVALLIFVAGFKASKETVDILIGSSPSKELVTDIYEFTKNYDGVYGIHDLVIHDYGPGRKFITLHVEVPEDINITLAHNMIDKLERDLEKRFSSIVTIHMDPICVNDEFVNKMRDIALSASKEVDKDFSIHDFRMTVTEEQINLIFDLCVPIESNYHEEEAGKLVAEKLKSIDKKYNAIIKPEHPFV